MRLTPEQMQMVRLAVRDFGVLSVAADALGVPTRDLKAAVARDEFFAAEIADAMADHSDALYVAAVKRAVTGGSDPLLVKLLEAQRPEQFDGKVRSAASMAKTRPTGVTLRRFAENENGEVVDADAKPITPTPTEPLQIGFVSL